MTTETCPHCGAEKEKYDSGFVRYKCGSSMSRHIADDWASTLSSNCYLNQLAQRNAEIDRLRQAVLDEREACEAVAKAHVCDSRCKYAWGVDKFCKVAIAQEIRARGEER